MRKVKGEALALRGCGFKPVAEQELFAWLSKACDSRIATASVRVSRSRGNGTSLLARADLPHNSSMTRFTNTLKCESML